MKRSKPTINKGKGGGQEMLPSRHALSQLVGGTPEQRSMNNYAKLTPSGAGALQREQVKAVATAHLTQRRSKNAALDPSQGSIESSGERTPL